MTFAENIAFRVRRARELGEVPSKDLALRIGRSETYIWRLEHGQFHGVPVENLAEIARECGLPLVEMFPTPAEEGFRTPKSRTGGDR